MGSLADIAAQLMVSRDIEALLGEVVSALTALFPAGLLTVRLRGEGGGFLFRSSFEGREQERHRGLEIESTLARRAAESKRELTSAGLSPEVKRRADETLSLSRMTLAHRLARVVLLEQLYRAMTILRGEPYHK